MPTIQSTFTNKFGYYDINSNVKGVLLYNRDSLFFDAGDIVESTTHRLYNHDLGYYPLIQSLDGSLKVTYPQIKHTSTSVCSISTVTTANLYNIFAQSATATSGATASSISVTHNLGVYPLVQVMDSDGIILTNTQIEHTNTSGFTITLLSSQSVTVLYTTGNTSTQVISGTSTTITHNLGRYPFVQILDNSSPKKVIPVTIQHTNSNTFTVSTVASLSGTAVYL